MQMASVCPDASLRNRSKARLCKLLALLVELLQHALAPRHVGIVGVQLRWPLTLPYVWSLVQWLLKVGCTRFSLSTSTYSLIFAAAYPKPYREWNWSGSNAEDDEIVNADRSRVQSGKQLELDLEIVDNDLEEELEEIDTDDQEEDYVPEPGADEDPADPGSADGEEDDEEDEEEEDATDNVDGDNEEDDEGEEITDGGSSDEINVDVSSPLAFLFHNRQC